MKTEGCDEMCKSEAYNMYYLSAISNLGDTEEFKQAVQFKQVILFLGEFVTIAVLFGLLFVGLWLGCALDNECWQSYAGIR